MSRIDEKLKDLENLLAQRKFPQALQLGKKLTREKPTLVRAWLSRSEAARALADHDEAVHASARAVALDPASGMALAQHARCLLPGGDYRLLAPVLEQGLSARHESSWATDTLAACAVGMDDWSRARRYYEQLVTQHGTEGRYRHMLAVACNVLGDVEMAKKQLRRLIRQQPAFGGAYWSLMDVDPESITPELEQEIERYCQDWRLDEPRKMHFYHVRGSIAHRDGDYAQAFKWYSKANSVKRTQVRYSLEDDERVFAAIQQGFSEAHQVPDAPADGPVFVVGLPRSGTTLIEQLLVSSGDMAAPGELRDFEALLSKPHPVVHALSDEQLVQLPRFDAGLTGREYLDRVAARAPAGQRVVDKNPFNFRFVGAILRALPNARIVHIRKNPMDACFGLYRHIFASVAPWSYTQGEIAAYYRLYTELMLQWQKQYPGHVLTVDYESLVQNPGEIGRKLYGHCGLVWSDDVLSSGFGSREIHSASASQVRQGLNDRSLGIARQYKEQLAPLEKQLVTWKLI